MDGSPWSSILIAPQLQLPVYVAAIWWVVERERAIVRRAKLSLSYDAASLINAWANAVCITDYTQKTVQEPGSEGTTRWEVIELDSGVEHSTRGLVSTIANNLGGTS
jgi:hypothetical protein